MDVNRLYRLIEDFYGFKCRMRGANSVTKEVESMLYDSFVLICGLDDRYGGFGARLEVGKNMIVTEFLGKHCSLNSDEQSIKESLQLIDDNCRLSLPDKYLEEYHKVYVQR